MLSSCRASGCGCEPSRPLEHADELAGARRNWRRCAFAYLRYGPPFEASREQLPPSRLMELALWLLATISRSGLGPAERDCSQAWRRAGSSLCTSIPRMAPSRSAASGSRRFFCNEPGPRPRRFDLLMQYGRWHELNVPARASAGSGVGQRVAANQASMKSRGALRLCAGTRAASARGPGAALAKGWRQDLAWYSIVADEWPSAPSAARKR